MATSSKPSRPFFCFDFPTAEDLHTREATTVTEELAADSDISTELTLGSGGGSKKRSSSDFLNPKKTDSMDSLGCKELGGPSSELVLYDESWWHVRKELTVSDVSNLMRLLLTTKSVQEHILPTMSPEQIEKINSTGLEVKVLDVVQGREHYLVFKKWKRPSSYIFIRGWNEKFVEDKKLKKGDVIGLIWDAHNTIFYFRVLSRN